MYFLNAVFELSLLRWKLEDIFNELFLFATPRSLSQGSISFLQVRQTLDDEQTHSRLHHFCTAAPALQPHPSPLSGLLFHQERDNLE